MFVSDIAKGNTQPQIQLEMGFLVGSAIQSFTLGIISDLCWKLHKNHDYPFQ